MAVSKTATTKMSTKNARPTVSANTNNPTITLKADPLFEYIISILIVIAIVANTPKMSAPMRPPKTPPMMIEMSGSQMSIFSYHS